MTTRMLRRLDGVTRVRGVRGAMLVSADDGLTVAESLMEDVRGNAVAALAASLTKRLGNAGRASGIGSPRFVHLQGDDGVLLSVLGPEGLVLVVIGEADLNVGLVRLEMLRALEGVV